MFFSNLRAKALLDTYRIRIRKGSPTVSMLMKKFFSLMVYVNVVKYATPISLYLSLLRLPKVTKT